MLKEAIYHKLYSDYAYAISKEDLLIKIRTKKDDVEGINLIYLDKYKYHVDKKTFIVSMKKVATDNLFDYFEAVIKHNFISVNYYFEIINGQEKLYYGNYMFSKEQPKDTAFFNFPVSPEADIFLVPEWAKKAVVYQIFPERFNNGDHTLDSKDVKPWYSEVKRDTMLGGDLRGIIKKLDYIEDLGINTIYMTPIFKAGSNHKYDTYDYFEVDPQFGTLDTLKELVKKAHEKNIRVIMDAVFNHSGVDFIPFKDIKKYGEKSKYKEWFYAKKFPLKTKGEPNYGTFAYVSNMPKLNTKNEATKKYLIDVATYWIKEADIDGWRLDVADEIDHEFWRTFRKEVKKVKEDVLIIGEVWYDSSSWLQGDQFDSVMNYIFSSAVNDFIAEEKIDAKEFGERLGFLRGLYKLPAYNVLWNLIDSHDTPRFLFTCNEDIDKLKLAVFMQLTFTGIPMIYYGDELGMTGGKDPDCRRGMLWDENRQNKELKAYYKKLLQLRREKKVLTEGSFITINNEEEKNLYAFRRELAGDIVEGYINNSSTDKFIKIKNSDKVINLITEEIVEGNIKLPSKDALLLGYINKEK